MLKSTAHRLLRGIGLEVTRISRDRIPFDIEEHDRRIIMAAQPYTMTSAERLYALIASVRHVVRAGVDGAIVECGVWKGGSMVAAALTLLEIGQIDRDLFLFDTFSGMTAPSSADVDCGGNPAADVFRSTLRRDGSSDWCRASAEQVREVLRSTAYPSAKINLVVGQVEDTLPSSAPEQIAILRLDTDWYASTRHELEHLYPRLTTGGVLIVDDYGHWRGARQACDEYFVAHPPMPFLHRVDYTGRIAIKP